MVAVRLEDLPVAEQHYVTLHIGSCCGVAVFGSGGPVEPPLQVMLIFAL